MCQLLVKNEKEKMRKMEEKNRQKQRKILALCHSVSWRS